MPVVPVGSLLERVEENEEEPVNPGSHTWRATKMEAEQEEQCAGPILRNFSGCTISKVHV